MELRKKTDEINQVHMKESRNFPALMVIVLVFSFFPQTIYPQYVRRESFGTERERRLKYELNDWVSYLKSRQISAATVGTDYIYFGTLDGGILRFDYFEDSWDYPFTTSSGLPDNKILNVVFDKNTSFLWAVTEDDIAIFKPAEREWLRRSEADFWPYTFPDTSQPGQEIRQNIFYPREFLSQLPPFFANGDYTIIDDWVLMDRFFREFPITGFLKDFKERLWFVVDEFGIGVGDLFSHRADFYEFGLPAIIPVALEYQYYDLWIGGLDIRSGRPGIALWLDGQIGWQYFEARWISHLPDENVRDILVQGDSVWFATEYGLSLYDAGKNRWKNFNLKDGLISNLILDVEILGDYIYTATDQGISRINRLTGGAKPIKDNRFLNLQFNQLAAQKDTLWAATDRGIFRLVSKPDRWEFVSSKAAIQDLRMSAVTNYRDEMWFASEGGIMRLNLKTDRWESFPQIAMEILPPYRDIKVNEKSVWVATASGLLKYDKINKFWKLFTVEDGLLDNNCHRLLLDGEYIWITTDKGITNFYWDNPNRID